MKIAQKHINSWLFTISNEKFIILSLFVSICSRFLFNNIIIFLFNQENGLENPIVNRYSNIYIKLILSLILAPVIETFLFFFLPYRFVKFLNVKFDNLSIYGHFVPISAFLFALNHSFNITYFLSSLFGGIIMAIFYIISENRSNNPFTNTIIFHSLYNTFVFFVKYL